MADKTLMVAFKDTTVRITWITRGGAILKEQDIVFEKEEVKVIYNDYPEYPALPTELWFLALVNRVMDKDPTATLVVDGHRIPVMLTGLQSHPIDVRLRVLGKPKRSAKRGKAKR